MSIQTNGDNQPVDWYKLKPEQKNRLIHTRVMSNPEFCDGRLIITSGVPYNNVLHNAISSHLSYTVYVCDKCNITGTCDTKQEAPTQHAPNDMPNYSEDMNAALLIATHERFSHTYFTHVQASPPAHWMCSLYWIDDKGARQITIERASSLLDATCIAALKACGVEVQA